MDVRLCYVIIQLYSDVNALFFKILDYFKLDFIVLNSIYSWQKLFFWTEFKLSWKADVQFTVGSDLVVKT